MKTLLPKMSFGNAETERVFRELLDACDEADTAFATIHIGRDHGLTPQGLAAMLNVWPKVLLAYHAATGSERAKDCAATLRKGAAKHTTRQGDSRR